MLQAKEFMTATVVSIEENATVKDAAKMVIRKNADTLLVTKNNLPIASVGKKELIGIAAKKNASNIKIKEIMDTDFIIVEPDTPYKKIEHRFRKYEETRCPVIDNNKLVGIITETDVMNTARDFTKNQQLRQDATVVVFGVMTAVFLFLYSPIGQTMLGLG